ncbi:MAG: hypothetical protein ABIN67_16535 [Ferruginibacter sp.]
MPQNDPSPTVSFTIPVKKDSQATGYKTVHVVVVPRKVESEEAGFEVILLPMIIVFLIAGIIIFLSLRVTPGSKAERILSKLEGSSNMVDRIIESGDL